MATSPPAKDTVETETIVAEQSDSATQQQPEQPKSICAYLHGIFSLLVLFTAFFLAQYDTTTLSLSYFQVPITQELHISAEYATGVSFVILSVPLAFTSDHGRARVWILTGSVIWWSLCVLFQGLSQTYWQIACARVGMGIGQSAVEALISLPSPARPRMIGWGIETGQVATLPARMPGPWRWSL